MELKGLVQSLLKLSPPNIVLVRLREELSYFDLISLLLRRIIGERNQPVVFVTGSRPANNLVEKLRSHGFDAKTFLARRMLIIVDCLSRSVAAPKIEGVLFVSSPSDLGELQLYIERAFRRISPKGSTAWLLMDGLATFLIFNGTSRVLQFLIFLTGRLRALGHYGVIFSYTSGLEDEIQNVIRQYVDVVFEV